MSRSFAIVLLLPIALSAQVATKPPTASASRAATTAASHPDRAIRRDIPMYAMIRRAFAAGSRDSSGRPTAKYWQQFVEYTISARLDVPTKLLTGRETIMLHNNSEVALNAIVMRLDQNIYAPNVPRDQVVPDITDGMKITKLTVNGVPADLNAPAGRGGGRGGGGGAPATPRLSGANLTVARIALSSPIAAHGTGTLDIEWNFRVPRDLTEGGGLRMGNWGDSLFALAQWYPRIAMFDDLRSGGWDTDPYLGNSEFYNNFGRFDVSLDLPLGWIVGATGVLQNPDQTLPQVVRDRLSHVLESDSQRTIALPADYAPKNPGRQVWHFVADTAGDFAWSTSSKYIWDATRANIPGKGYIPVNVMYLAGHRGFNTAGAIVRHALEFYSKLWMPFAFPVMTMVDAPDGGMEYPMFVMSGASAVDHETGHQWWPMTVGVNETWYAFMDEGFNQYMNILSDADRSGGRGGRGGRGGGGGCSRTLNPTGGVGLLNCAGQQFGPRSLDETVAPLIWDANYGGPQYQEQAYDRAPQMLSMLGGIVGDSAVLRAMSEYAKAWRFKHPSPYDYAFFMSKALGKDLDWFWYYWLFTTESVDGSIKDVKTALGKTTVTVHQDGQMPSPVVLAVTFAAKGAPIRMMPNSKLIDSVTAIVTYPVDVWWSGSKDFNAALSFGGRAIEKIVLDPYGRFPDRNTLDNTWVAPAPAAAPVKPAPAPGRGAAGGRGGG